VKSSRWELDANQLGDHQRLGSETKTFSTELSRCDLNAAV
jgi:hypothetical protein